MIFRIFSVWIAIIAAFGVSFFSSCTAGWMGGLIDRFLSGKPLPAISSWFYTPGALIYWFPVPLFLWAVVFSVFFRRDAEHAALLRALSLGCSMVFLSVFIFAIALPFLPMSPRPLSSP
jgi:hypothetical protein